MSYFTTMPLKSKGKILLPKVHITQNGTKQTVEIMFMATARSVVIPVVPKNDETFNHAVGEVVKQYVRQQLATPAGKKFLENLPKPEPTPEVDSFQDGAAVH
jgi:hypothetical protein